MTDSSVDLTPQLRELMTKVELSSWAQLSRMSGVPRSQLVKLRRGEIERIPLGSLLALAQALQVSLTTILETLGAIAVTDPSIQAEVKAAEDSHNASSLEEGEEAARQWQQSGLDTLESLIVQLPTAAFAAENNPTAPAVRLLPLLKPLEQLLTSWNVHAIGEVGQPIAFNPQYHQWMGGAEMPDPGTLVKVRYVGYLHGDRLLHRAKVGPR